MEIINTSFEGLKIIKTKYLNDSRGIFNKVYNKDFFKKNNLNYNFEEFFYSESQKNVIRGMHFQIPPYEHEKIVFVAKGKIMDVVIDLRKKSKTYGKYYNIELSFQEGKCIYIPKGFAHGFKSIENNTIVCYLTTSMYKEDCDSGINIFGFGYNWDSKNPIISNRDSSFCGFKEFKSPF